MRFYEHLRCQLCFFLNSIFLLTISKNQLFQCFSRFFSFLIKITEFSHQTIYKIKTCLKIIVRMIRFIEGKELDLTGKALIISSASIGGVGTMALDMFIMNNDFKRVAYFQTKMLEPCVGLLPSRIAKDVIGLPAEFYLKGDVLILQLRSKNKKGRKEDLVKEIASLADKYLFSEIIFVSSLSNSNRPDNEIRSQKKNIYFKVKGPTNLKTIGSLPFETLYDADEKDVDEDDILEGSGLCTKAFKVFPRAIAFFIFADPVWDIQSAVFMAKVLRQILGFKQLSEKISILPEEEKKF